MLICKYILKCNDYFRKIKLPAEDPYLADELKDDIISRASTRVSRYTVEMPKAAVAGLVGELAEKLDEIQDMTVRVVPVSHTWAPNGDVFIGCKGGQLVKVCYYGDFGPNYSLFLS